MDNRDYCSLNEAKTKKLRFDPTVYSDVKMDFPGNAEIKEVASKLFMSMCAGSGGNTAYLDYFWQYDHNEKEYNFYIEYSKEDIEYSYKVTGINSSYNGYISFEIMSGKEQRSLYMEPAHFDGENVFVSGPHFNDNFYGCK